MNEEDQIRYDELFDLSKDELAKQVMDAEHCMDHHDKEMQRMERENNALKRRLEDMTFFSRRGKPKDWDAIYSPEYYLREYEDYTREDLMLVIMDLRITLRGMFHD